MKPAAVYLQHIPEWAVKELDRRWNMVDSGSITVHKNDGEAVKFEHRDCASAQQVRATK